MSSLQAKKQQLESSVAQLDIRLTDGRAAIDVRHQKYQEKLEASLDVLHADETATRLRLESLTSEMFSLEKMLDAQRKAIDIAEAEHNAIQETIAMERHELQDIQNQIQTAEIKLETTTGDIQNAMERHTELQSAIAAADAMLQQQTDAIDQATARLVRLESDYTVRSATHDSDLRSVLLKTKDAVARLQELEAREAVTRSDIATRTMELDKREAVIRRLELKLKGAESKVQQYNSFMKL